MYSKQEASHIRQEFWTAFGRYMQPVLSAEGETINWINYKTGVRHIYFRMDAGKGARISIELNHPDAAVQKEQFTLLTQMKQLLYNSLQEEWEWVSGVKDEHGKIHSLVFKELSGVHLFNKADWPALISFFKPRIIALDAFWSDVKPAFEV